MLHGAHAIRLVVGAAVALVVISSSALAAAASHPAAPEPQGQSEQWRLVASHGGSPAPQVVVAQDRVAQSRPSHLTATQARLAQQQRRQDAAAAQTGVREQAEVRQRAAAQQHQAALQQAAQQQAAKQGTPAETQAVSAGSVPQIIQQAFAPLGPAAVQWALTIARRESNYDPGAQNPSGASGLFQFMPSTFAKSPPGQAGKSIWDPVANAEAAAWMYTLGRQNEWSTNY